jgi:hypothetical protein
MRHDPHGNEHGFFLLPVFVLLFMMSLMVMEQVHIVEVLRQDYSLYFAPK